MNIKQWEIPGVKYWREIVFGDDDLEKVGVAYPFTVKLSVDRPNGDKIVIARFNSAMEAVSIEINEIDSLHGILHQLIQFYNKEMDKESEDVS